VVLLVGLTAQIDDLKFNSNANQAVPKTALWREESCEACSTASITDAETSLAEVVGTAIPAGTTEPKRRLYTADARANIDDGGNPQFRPISCASQTGALAFTHGPLIHMVQRGYPMKVTPEKSPQGTSTRRALIGIGGAAAMAMIAGQTAAAARADTVAGTPTDSPTAPPMAPSPSSTSTPTPTPTSTSRPGRTITPRKVASTPIYRGGPESADESAAAAMQVLALDVPVGAQYASCSAAIRAATPIPSALFAGTDWRNHLLRRATFGPRSADIADLKRLGIDGWLKYQLSPSKIKDTEAVYAMRSFSLYGASAKTLVARKKDFSWDGMLHTTYGTLAKQTFSKRQLFEITADVMANHLHINIPGEQWATSPGWYTNVIRKYTFGKYSDMLIAAMKHPAMLNFLNNDESVKEHVNENLGRELLELHTVGIGGGYTEDDVQNSAKILSGRSWQWDLWGHRSTYGTYKYNANDHWTGYVKVLDFEHANTTGSGGHAVGDAYIRYLAHHPATARRIARKIATRFVCDEPSDDLVQRLADVYLAHDTSIREVVRAVFLSSDFWSATGTRMRRPLEDAVGSVRVLNMTRGTKVKSAIGNLYWNLDQAGHTPHGWVPPNGYPDVAASWLGASAMLQRWNMHRGLIGWGFQFGRKAAKDLVPRTSKTTCDAWVRALAVKLLGVPMSDEHIAAVLTGSDLPASEPINWHWWKCGHAAALILDSPYFQLR
jgi:hypothetical protein